MGGSLGDQVSGSDLIDNAVSGILKLFETFYYSHTIKSVPNFYNEYLYRIIAKFKLSKLYQNISNKLWCRVSIFGAKNRVLLY